MKRLGNLIEQIADFDNIAFAAYKAFRGKADREDVKKYRRSFNENIQSLSERIRNGSVEVGNYKEFTVFEPKERLISVAPLEQRILHHSIMNVCHDRFERHLIYHSYASRREKGSHKAILNVKDNCRKYRYYVKLDIQKFFYSIDHSILKLLLRRIFKDEILLILFDKIIDSYGGEFGVPIGNLTSQYFANYYLSFLDHYMLEYAGVSFYVRYMDDVIIMEKEKSKLRNMISLYCDFAAIVLNLKVKPPVVGKSCNGIPFLGYKVFQNRILINGKGKRRYKRNIKRLKELFRKDLITEQEYSQRLNSNIAYVKFADSFKFRSNILDKCQ